MFKPKHIYPLRDTSEYGPRFKFALTQDDPFVSKCWIVDCWIVDAHGVRHSGVDCSSVPVARDQVYISRGEPCEVEHESVRGGWLA